MFKIKKATYIKILNHFKKNKLQYNILKIIYKLLPICVVAFYCLLVLYTFIWQFESLIKVICIPAMVLIIITVLRKVINRQRPYEKHKTESLFSKTSVGESMPSRHTASAFIISMTALYVNIYIGIVMLIASCLIALSRVLAGVHHISDVVVASVISICFGMLFYII